MTDEELAMGFLRGDEGTGNKQNTEGQRALLRLLKSDAPMSARIRKQLAVCISATGPRDSMRLALKGRRRGPHKHSMRNASGLLELAYEGDGKKQEEAIALAAEKRIGRTRVMKARKSLRKVHPKKAISRN